MRPKDLNAVLLLSVAALSHCGDEGAVTTKLEEPSPQIPKREIFGDLQLGQTRTPKEKWQNHVTQVQTIRSDLTVTRFDLVIIRRNLA